MAFQTLFIWCNNILQVSLRKGKITNHQLNYDIPLIVKCDSIVSILKCMGIPYAPWDQGNMVATRKNNMTENVIYSAVVGLSLSTVFLDAI